MNTNGRYLYGVVSASLSAELGEIGLDGEKVYVVACRDVAAVVHDCPDKAYVSDDKEKVKCWVMAHDAVIENAWERYGSIVTASFDTIIKGGTGALSKWLAENHDRLVSRLGFLSGKAEYSVQLTWDEKKVSEETIKTDAELMRLQKDSRIASPGTEYLYQKRIEKRVRDCFNEKAADYRASIFEKIKEITNEIVIEKLKESTEGRKMIMNVSCLIRRGDEGRLGLILEEEESKGCGVRFTGPWPPYSFSGKDRG